MPSSIYTVGIHSFTEDLLLHHIKALGINCVVDIRSKQIADGVGAFQSATFKQFLSRYGIFYLPFHEYFSHIPFECMNSRGKVVIDKYVKTDQFVSGINRIKNGVSKGYVILIMDDTSHAKDSFRYSAIGKELCKCGINIMHIEPDHFIMSQQQIEELIRINKAKKKSLRQEAYALGMEGEEIAGLYLIHNGFTIIDRNWNLHRGNEIDIVALKDNVLHFIEVKTRKQKEESVLAPQSAIDYKKLKSLRNAIREYLYRNNIRNIQKSIDSIAILYRSSNDYDIKLYEGIGKYM